MRWLLALFLLVASPAFAQNTFFAGNPGDMIYRGTTGWVRVPGGTAGQLLQSNGPTAAPIWSNGFGTFTTFPFVLPAIPTNRALGNVTGSNAAPVAITLSQFLDTVGYDTLRPAAPGAMVYKDGTTGTWQATTGPATAGYVLTMQVNGTPSWVSAGSGGFTVTNHAVAIGTGAVGFRDAVPGTSGQVLASTGATTDPAFTAIVGLMLPNPSTVDLGGVFATASSTAPLCGISVFGAPQTCSGGGATTGTGLVVLQTSPTIITPTISGSVTTSTGTLPNLTGVVRLSQPSASPYYVRATGDDTTCNGGTDVASPGSPIAANCAFATIQKAVNVASSRYQGLFATTINVTNTAAGVGSTIFAEQILLRSYSGGPNNGVQPILIVGINNAGGTAPTIRTAVGGGVINALATVGTWQIKNFILQAASASAYCVQVTNGASVIISAPFQFAGCGAPDGIGLFANQGGKIQLNGGGTYFITGAMGNFMFAKLQGSILAPGQTFAIGAVAITYFAQTTDGGMIQGGSSYIVDGGMTGTAYHIESGGIISGASTMAAAIPTTTSCGTPSTCGGVIAIGGFYN